MNKKMISKYDKCNHILVCVDAYEKDNDVIYRYACPKCMLDERVLDKNINILNKEQLEQKKYIVSHNVNIPGKYIPKYCANLGKLHKSYIEYKKNQGYKLNDQEVIDLVTRKIIIDDKLSYLENQMDERYKYIREKQYEEYNKCLHSKVVTGISKKTGAIRYGCPKCKLDERLLDKPLKNLSGLEQIEYDYLASGYFDNCGRVIGLYYPDLNELISYYENNKKPDTFEGYQEAEDEIVRHILIKTKNESVLIKNVGRK